MKKHFIFPLLLSFIALKMKSQTDAESRIKNLEIIVQSLQNKQRSFDKRNYSITRENLIIAVELSEQLSSVYKYVEGDVKTADIYNKLNRLNNPTSDILGFKFSDIIISKANDIFKTPEFRDVPEKKKSKFLSVLEKITNNPISSVIQSVFPITGTVRSVITAAASFFSEPSVELNVVKSGGKVTDIGVKDVKGDNGLDNKFIEAYVQSLQPYLSFYESLEYSNLQFELATEELLKRYKNLPYFIKSLEEELNNKLDFANNKIAIGQKTSEIDRLSEFSQSSATDFDFTRFTSKENIIEANNIAKQIGMAGVELENFYSEFTKIVNDKFNSDKATLEEARKLKGAVFSKIDTLKKSIEEAQKSGIVNKYQNSIDKIIVLRNKIIY
jgi:hypothetical protein